MKSKKIYYRRNRLIEQYQREQALIKKYENKDFNINIILEKLKLKDCSWEGYHFLFGKLKVCLEIGGIEVVQDNLLQQVRSIEKERPNLLDNLLTDNRLNMPGEENLHPWRVARIYKKKSQRPSLIKK